MDDMEYLQPAFDPSSLTVPRLRNILVTHDIRYPDSAKKAQLVNIFNHDLKPQARKLLSARDRVRRTSRGISDMPSNQEGNAEAFETDDTSLLPSSRPRQPKSRKAGLSSSVEPTAKEKSNFDTNHSGTRSSSEHARKSDTGSDHDGLEQVTKGRPRKSRASPAVKIEERDEASVRPSLPNSAFSDENPFQSGSSPLNAEAGRRRSAGMQSERRKTSSNRRKTEGVLNTNIKREGGINVSNSKTFEMPVSALENPKVRFDPAGVGEEFTPEEQLELTQQRATENEGRTPGARTPSQPRKPRIPTYAPWLVLSALLVGYATWYRQEKLMVGYCGIGKTSDALSNVNVPDWADFLLPSCEPCPQHAICYEEMETRCDSDFVLTPHPLSIGGLIPLPPTCEPDGVKVRRVKAVADRAIETLRERKAKAECGTLKDESGKQIGAETPEPELKKEVGKSRNRAISAQEFEDLWKDAIGEVMGREEVISSNDGRLLSSTSLARLPVACAIRRSAHLALARNKQSISLLSLVLCLIAYIRSRILTSRADTARVPSLVATTLDRLATQAALHARGDILEAWISVGQLRDDILRDVFSDKRRENLWTRVRAIVERNANVRASVREGRGGDVSRVWEWIGSIGLIEEPYSDRTRSRGKRVSFGGLIDEGTPNEKLLMSDQDHGGASGDTLDTHMKWDEGRPLY